MDTIDVSNLNRQFLFRSQHVGMPKCVVASEAALNMVPPLSVDGTSDTNGNAAKYKPHHGNVSRPRKIQQATKLNVHEKDQDESAHVCPEA